MQEEAAVFKALSDPTRLRLAVLLATRGETCVCELAGALDEPDYKISRHLAVLRNAGLVQGRREGAWMHYQLTSGQSDLHDLLQACFHDCLSARPSAREDLRRLEASCGQNAERCGEPAAPVQSPSLEPEGLTGASCGRDPRVPGNT